MYLFKTALNTSCARRCTAASSSSRFLLFLLNSTRIHKTVLRKRSLCFLFQTYLHSESADELFYKVVELEESYVLIKKVFKSEFSSSSYEQNSDLLSICPELSDMLLSLSGLTKSSISLPLWLVEFKPLATLICELYVPSSQCLHSHGSSSFDLLLPM